MVKRLIKRGLPGPILQLVRYYRNGQYNNLSVEQIFTKIYENGVWGKSQDPSRPFYSGSGSDRNDEVVAYVRSVGDFLRSFQVKPSVVDLGCGDFNVGSQIRKFCDRYVACDVVPNLVAFNKVRYKDFCVEFKLLDLIDGELPSGDVAFVRQVLQHLSNEQISRFVARISSTYNFLVVTEHLPSRPTFKHNVDKFTGAGTRMGHESGIVLTSPPFNLRPKMEKVLCRVNSVDMGILVTTLYEL